MAIGRTVRIFFGDQDCEPRGLGCHPIEAKVRGIECGTPGSTCTQTKELSPVRRSLWLRSAQNDHGRGWSPATITTRKRYIRDGSTNFHVHGQRVGLPGRSGYRLAMGPRERPQVGVQFQHKDF